MSFAVITEIESTTMESALPVPVTIQSIKLKIDDMWNARSGYHLIYVSIGGKLNEISVIFNHPDSVKNKRFETNATKQMMPCFIRYRKADQKALVITIDDFNTINNLKRNCDIIDKYIDNNVDVLVIDKYCTRTFVEEFTEFLIHKIRINQIPEQNIMICNYVKFINDPNAMEAKAEHMIPVTIQQILDKPENIKYSRCLYEWFGYRFYLYNFVYCYKTCHLYFSAYTYINELEAFMKCQHEDNMKSTAVVQNINTIRFWESIYDITTMSYEQFGIAINLKDYLIENGQLEPLVF